MFRTSSPAYLFHAFDRGQMTNSSSNRTSVFAIVVAGPSTEGAAIAARQFAFQVEQRDTHCLLSVATKLIDIDEQGAINTPTGVDRLTSSLHLNRLQQQLRGTAADWSGAVIVSSRRHIHRSTRGRSFILQARQVTENSADDSEYTRRKDNGNAPEYRRPYIVVHRPVPPN
jgi:hypothetical protein